MDFFSLFITAFGSGYFCFNLLRRSFSQDARHNHTKGMFDLLLAALALHGLFIWSVALFSVLHLPLPRFWFIADSFIGSLLYPLVYLTLKTFLDPGSVSARTRSLHFLPLIFLGISNLLLQTRASTSSGLSAIIGHLYDYMNIILSPYLIVSALILLRSVRSSEIYARNRKKLLSITVCTLFVVVILAFAYSPANMKLFDAIAFGIILLFFVVLEIRYISAEKFFTEVKEQYKRTRLASFDLEALGVQLTRIFEDEKIFLREDLTLESVADHLGLSLHQVSEYLNRFVGKNFQQFVKEYRIRHACELLKSEPTMSVLEIGFASGFGTKSSFNSSFRETMACTPSVYRARGFSQHT